MASRLSIPFALYAVSVALSGVTVWQFCETLPLRRPDVAREVAHRGVVAAGLRLDDARRQERGPRRWRYTIDNRAWWEQFGAANVRGVLPTIPGGGEAADDGNGTGIACGPGPTPPVTLELLVYDSENRGRGAGSHAVVRYLPGTEVAPPPSANSLLVQRLTPGPGVGRGELWPPFEHIHLERVAPDARSAFFRVGDDTVEVEKAAVGLDPVILRQVLDVRSRVPAAGR